jgi:hypothetical protein
MSEQSTLFGECSHPRKNVVPEKRGPHYAKQVCADCGKFLKWIASPETIKRQAENAGILAQLAMCRGLSEWDREFVRSAARQKHLSPKQQAVLFKLRDTHLGKEAAYDGFDGEKMSPDGNPPNHL